MNPSYKHTEVGVIPNTWEVFAIGSLGSVIRGASPRPKGDKRFYGGDIPRLMVEDVTRDKKFVTPRIDFLTTLGAKQSRPCKRGTLTIVCSGTPAVVGKPSFLAVDACIHDGMMALINVSSNVVPDYLFHQLSSHQERLYQSATHGGTFVNLTTSGFRAFKVALPQSPTEQRAIAEALSDVDGLLGGLDRLIAKKRDLKQAAMQQLLTGQTRLPGFHDEWEVTRLGECLLSRPDYGINAAAVPFSDKLPRYIRITDISEHGHFCSTPRVCVNAPSADQYYLREGDLVFARTGASVGKSYLYEPRDGELVFAGFLIRVRPHPKRLNSAYLAAYASTKPYWNWVHLMSMRSGQPGINGNEYAQLPLSLPPLLEQTAIAAVLTEMDAELSALETRREKTRALKQGMMQELLTGRTRLV